MKLGFIIFLSIIILNIQSVLATEGFTVMSVSRPDIISPKEDLSGKWWLITISANGGGQSIVGTITPDELKQKTGGWGSKFPLTVRVTSKKEIVQYPLKVGENPVYSYDMRKTECSGIFCGYFVEAPGCEGGTYRTIDIHGLLKVVKRLCIFKNQIGKTGYLESPITKFYTDIELIVQNNVISKEISSDDQSVYFNPQAQASWQGSLVTGIEPPNPAQYVPTLKKDSGRWKLSQESTFDEYNRKYLGIENFIISNNDETEIRNKIDDMNAISNKLLEEEAIGFSATEGGFMYESTGKFITNPVITFKIRADWIGITIPFGIPKIILQDNKIQWKSNEKGLINLSITNIGDADGHFLSTIENCSFKQSYISSPIDVAPGDTVSTNLTIDVGNIAENITEKCSIRVYDKNHPEYFDTVDYDLTVIKVVPSFPQIVQIVEDPVRNIGMSIAPICRVGHIITVVIPIIGTILGIPIQIPESFGIITTICSIT